MKKFIVVGFVLVSVSASATDNIFNADMSNPDLSTLISSFEQVCMPFVLHETELTRENDWRHTVGQMENLGFASQSIVTRSRRVEFEPAREEWKPRSQNINSSFTVFNRGFKTGNTIVNPTGEIDMRAALIPPMMQTVTYQVETYKKDTEPRLKAILDWNYPSQKDPGKACAINLERINMRSSLFHEAFISKDDGWKEVPDKDTPKLRWSQCVSDADNDFEFTAVHSDNKISLLMKRSDFYEPKLCLNNSKQKMH